MLPRTARELMTPAPYTLRSNDLAHDAAGRLLREGHSGAPVLDRHGRLVGVVSEQDFIHALQVVERKVFPTRTVAEVMTPDPLTLRPDATVYEVARFFTTYPIRRAPVVEQGQLVGLVSRHDVLAALWRLCLECRKAQRNHVPFHP